MNSSQWASAYDDVFPFNQQKFNFLHHHLKGEYILDVGCATGEYALKFASLGYRVNGIDLSKEMIEQARLKDSSGSAIFEVFDMTKPLKKDTYDSIYIIGNTLVYLKDEGEIKKTLQNFLRH